jgi:hypothetical protein
MRGVKSIKKHEAKNLTYDEAVSRGGDSFTLSNSGEEGRKQADGEGGGPGRHHHNDEYVQLPAEQED